MSDPLRHLQEPSPASQADPIEQAEREYQRTMWPYHQRYSTWCLPSHEWQRSKLEALRSRFQYHSTDLKLMAPLHGLYRWLCGR